MNFKCTWCGEHYIWESEMRTRCSICKDWYIKPLSMSEVDAIKKESYEGATAMRFNEGKLQWHLLYFPFIEWIIKVLEFWKKKYSEWNWMLHMDKNTILDSSMRHHVALMKWELIDPESWLPHIHHIACNQMFYDYHYGENKE